MIPDPILAVLALVGLFAYTLAGSLATIVFAKVWFSAEKFQRYVHLKQKTAGEFDGMPVALIAWPIVAAAHLVAFAMFGIVYAVGVGPWWLARHAIPYVGQAFSQKAEELS